MMRRIKNDLLYHLARLALSLAGRTPEVLVPFIGRAVGVLASWAAVVERRLALRNLSNAGLLPRIMRDMFRHLGTGAVELGRIFYGRSQPEVAVPAGSLRALDEALLQGKGVIYVTGHIGNWELMARELARRGYPISTMARESYDPRFTRLIEEFRRSGGVDTIYRNRPGAAARIVRTLKKGRVLGFLIDQNTRVPSVDVPFFGRPAPTPSGPAVIALRTRTPVVVGTIRRLDRGSHEIEISRVPLDHQSDTVETVTARFSRMLEERIRQVPEQWVWLHHRWND